MLKQRCYPTFSLGTLGFIAFLLFSGASTGNAKTFHLMLTEFDAFGGRESNFSQVIAQGLKQNASQLGKDVEVSVCRLPVVYGKSSLKVKSCYQDLTVKPDAVISFGEASCGVRLETAVENRDHTPGFPDNEGNERSNHEIKSEKPARDGFDFPVDSMFCALKKNEDFVSVSNSLGNYVCNNTAYSTEELQLDKTRIGPKGEILLGVPYTFIHVPNSDCAAQMKIEKRVLEAVTRMVAAAVKTIRNARGNDVIFAMPANYDEAKSYMETLLSKTGTHSCRKNFAKQLFEVYSQSSANACAWK